jgi:hypothetical protein
MTHRTIVKSTSIEFHNFKPDTCIPDSWLRASLRTTRADTNRTLLPWTAARSRLGVRD